MNPCILTGDPTMLPEPLKKLQDEFPGIRIEEQPSPTISNINGRLSVLEHGIVLLHELSKLLWYEDKKFRVTIECDPDTGKFSAKREDF